jgi:hypothetical protein
MHDIVKRTEGEKCDVSAQNIGEMYSLEQNSVKTCKKKARY